jgi:hypothetical protein
MTANKGLRLYFLYCFLLGALAFPLHLTLNDLFPRPNPQETSVTSAIVSVILLAGIFSPFYRFAGFKQFLPPSRRTRILMLVSSLSGVLIELVIVALAGPAITMVSIRQVTLFVTLPIASGIIVLDLILAHFFGTKINSNGK